MTSESRAMRNGRTTGIVLRGIALGLLLLMAVIGLMEIPQDVLVFRYEGF